MAEPHDAKTLAAELRARAHSASKAHKMLAEMKSARNSAAEGAECHYRGLEPEQTLEWRAADALDGLAEAERAIAQRDALVERLKALNSNAHDDWSAAVGRAESAEAKLSALQEEVGRLREALEPFADYASQDGFGLDYHGRELPDGDGPGWVYVTNGDFRRARSALARTAGGKDDG